MGKEVYRTIDEVHRVNIIHQILEFCFPRTELFETCWQTVGSMGSIREGEKEKERVANICC